MYPTIKRGYDRARCVAYTKEEYTNEKKYAQSGVPVPQMTDDSWKNQAERRRLEVFGGNNNSKK